MKKVIVNQIVRVFVPALLGALAAYIATAYPVVYGMICTVGAI